jgi:hypothetical protein
MSFTIGYSSALPSGRGMTRSLIQRPICRGP